MEIKVKDRIYKYEELPIYLGDRKIKKEVAKKNLQLLKEVLDRNNIKFCLFYGTLLGVIRENDLIEHDQDIDIFILEEDREKFMMLLFELLEYDFKVARYDIRGAMSLIRNEEYIDICFFKKSKDIPEARVCCLEYVPEIFFKKTVKINFLGRMYDIPENYKDFLLFEYGKNWKVPIEYKYNKIQKVKNYIMALLKKYLPQSIKKIFYSIKENKCKKIYTKKLLNFEENKK